MPLPIAENPAPQPFGDGIGHSLFRNLAYVTLDPQTRPPRCGGRGPNGAALPCIVSPNCAGEVGKKTSDTVATKTPTEADFLRASSR